MRFSDQIIKTTKEIPSGEQSKNAELLIRAGYIDKTMAGVFTLLPMGLKVLNNITRIIREEMESLGAEEVLMPALQPKEFWDTTGRWETMDVLYRVHSPDGSHEFGLGPTHEEVVTPLMKRFLLSYRDIPRSLFQIQTKFRFEPRAKSGILRGREFMMKDLYSFHTTEEDLLNFYERAAQAYFRVYERAGLKALKVRASGGAFSDFSHEFQVLADCGEDLVFHCDRACGFAENKEVATVAAGDVCPGCGAGKILESKAVEVGNIFPLYNKFSGPFNLTVKNQEGEDQKVLMGCYGIGCTRLLGTVVEVLADEKGLVWPDSIAPYQIHLVLLGSDEAAVAAAEDVYKQLRAKGVSVLFDDRMDVKAGEKFADADLMGIPRRVVISSKTVAAAAVEIKHRASGETALVPVQQFLDAPYV
ncbi:MAG: prolyl-tRNA synthetase [Patescibacteria group bacterium]|jgi:prolyl-tRNA synthetase|nr:prolyl-tRNA synthetase [Patescibacteria group bacterium]